VKLTTKPSDCTSKEAIREQIDRIDREIIHLFAQRADYVHEIVKFKADEESVIAIDRKELVIRQRSEWAEENGLNKDTFREIYSILLQQNIAEELRILYQNKH
jgi:chorismate mutase